jgi:hypothetical protein
MGQKKTPAASAQESLFAFFVLDRVRLLSVFFKLFPSPEMFHLLSEIMHLFYIFSHGAVSWHKVLVQFLFLHLNHLYTPFSLGRPN